MASQSNLVGELNTPLILGENRENFIDVEELERLKKTVMDIEEQLKTLKKENQELEVLSNQLDERVKGLTKQVRHKNKFMKEKLKDISKVIETCRYTQIHSLDRLFDIFHQK